MKVCNTFELKLPTRDQIKNILTRICPKLTEINNDTLNMLLDYTKMMSVN